MAQPKEERVRRRKRMGDEVRDEERCDLKSSAGGEMELVVHLGIVARLQSVGDEGVERQQRGDEADDARCQTKLAVGPRVQQADEDEHHGELQALLKHIDRSVPQYGAPGSLAERPAHGQ